MNYDEAFADIQRYQPTMLFQKHLRFIPTYETVANINAIALHSTQIILIHSNYYFIDNIMYRKHLIMKKHQIEKIMTHPSVNSKICVVLLETYDQIIFTNHDEIYNRLNNNFIQGEYYKYHGAQDISFAISDENTSSIYATGLNINKSDRTDNLYIIRFKYYQKLLNWINILYDNILSI